MVDCVYCKLWEIENLGLLANEAYASTAIEHDISINEMRQRVLSHVHETHSKGKK